MSRASASSAATRAARSAAQAGRRAHEHQAADMIGPIQCEPQREPATHRITDVEARAGVVTDRERGALERLAHGELAGEEHRIRDVGEALEDVCPRGAGLREALDEHDVHLRILADR
jgi:hypothetical protein